MFVANCPHVVLYCLIAEECEGHAHAHHHDDCEEAHHQAHHEASDAGHDHTHHHGFGGMGFDYGKCPFRTCPLSGAAGGFGMGKCPLGFGGMMGMGACFGKCPFRKCPLFKGGCFGYGKCPFRKCPLFKGAGACCGGKCPFKKCPLWGNASQFGKCPLFSSSCCKPLACGGGAGAGSTEHECCCPFRKCPLAKDMFAEAGRCPVLCGKAGKKAAEGGEEEEAKKQD